MDATTATFQKINPKQGDTMRRLLIVTKGPLDPHDPAVIELLRLANSLQCFTVMQSLKNGLAAFCAKFPYLCVKEGSTEAEFGLSLSRFPSIVSEGKLYIVRIECKSL